VCLSGAARECLPVGGLELAEHASAPDRIAVSAAGQFSWISACNMQPVKVELNRLHNASTVAGSMKLTAYRPVGMLSALFHTDRLVRRFMESDAAPRSVRTGSRQRLLDAAISLVREKGYAATSVDQVCERAGVTKGAFFHHFKSKDALAIAAASCWSEGSNAVFASAPYNAHGDPLDRLLGYLEFRKAMLVRELREITCFAGTMVQEVYATHPDLARACEASIDSTAAMIVKDIEAAMKQHRIRAPWTATSLALHTQAVLQGAIILAKAKGGVDVAIDSIDHLSRYIELLFKRSKTSVRRAATSG
jgi:TetR/AcrR family transcriptional repressor of nem operon